MTLLRRYILFAAALSAILLLIAAASWRERPRDGSILTAPILSGLDPNSAVAGSPGFTLTVIGASFTEHSSVHWNDSERASVIVNSGILRAEITASDVAREGTAVVTVVNPHLPNEHSGVSNVLAFRILPASSY